MWIPDQVRDDSWKVLLNYLYMLTLFLGLSILFFAFFEATLFLLPLTLLVVMSWGTEASGRRAFFLAFLSGIVIDLVTLRPLGMTSIVFLGLTFLIFLYGKKYRPSHFIFYVPATFVSLCVYQIIFYSQVSVPLLLISFVLSFPVHFCVRYLYLKFIPPEQMKLAM